MVYKEVFNGEVVTTKDAVTQFTGEAPSIPTSMRTPYCTYEYYSDESCTEELTELTNTSTTVFAKSTFTPPFTVSSNYDGATWYFMSLRNKGKYVLTSTTTPYPNVTSKPSASEALWAFFGDPYNGIKVMNARAGSGKYLKEVSQAQGSAITMQNSEREWAIGVGNGGFYLKVPGNNDLYVHDLGSTFSLWNSSSAKTDAGSGFQVEAATAVKVTYKLTFGGNVISSCTKDLYELVGATAAVPSDWVLPAYCSFGTCSPATITAETTEVTVPLIWDGPFEFSSSFSSAKWYYMTLREKYAQNDGNNPYQLSTSKMMATKAHWAFMGNPYAVKVINELAGDGKYLDDGTNPQMGTTGTEWIITESSKNGAFQLHVDANKYISDNGGYGRFSYWNSTSAINEDGGLLRVEEVPDNMMDEVTANIMPFVNNPGDGYFQLTTDKASMFNDAITTCNADGKISDVEYATLLSNLPNFLTYPNNGYYRIKNKGGNSYMGVNSIEENKNCFAGNISISDASTNLSTIIKVEKSGNLGIKLSTQGQYAQAQDGGRDATLGNEAPAAYFTLNAVAPGYATIKTMENSNTSYYSLYKGKISSWSPDGDTEYWSFEIAETVSLTLNAVGGKTYGTTYLPFDVTLPEGDVCAYTLTDNGNGWLHLNPLGTDGKSIPAGTPVLLRGTSTTSVTATIADVDDIDTGENVLSGTYFTMEHGDNLVLGKIDGVPGFYKYNFNIKPNKAYIAASAGAKAYKFMFDDEDATAIDNVNGNANNAAIYNIAGQRISKLQKGINIVNGKKVLY